MCVCIYIYISEMYVHIYEVYNIYISEMNG